MSTASWRDRISKGRPALGIAVSVVGLWLAFRHVDLREVGASLLELRAPPLVLTALPLLAGTLLRAIRWNILAGRRPLRPSLEAILVSTFFNGVLPFRAGDAVRPVYFARRTRSPLRFAVGAAIVERTLDVWTLATLGVVVFSGTRVAGATPPVVLAGIAAFLTVAGLVGFPVLQRFTGIASTRFGNLVARLAEGLAAVGSPARLAAAAVLSFVMWIVTAWPFTLALEASGAKAGLRDGLLILLVVTFAIALPSSPGFVGTFHAGFVLGAQILGIPRAQSLAAAVVLHLVLQVPFIVGGAAVLSFGGRALLDGATAPEAPEESAARR